MNEIQLVLKESEDNYRTNESYKSLRTNIEFAGDENKALVFTSCTPNEGKSYVSFFLALSMAEAGKKVIYVDADLRKSVFQGRYRIKGELKGMTHFLSGHADIEDVICKSDKKNLYVISAGPVPPNPTELLGGKRFTEIMDYLKGEFDYIIVDAPPIGSVIDAAVIAKNCDGVVLVISVNTVSYRFVQSARDQMEKSDCKILGVVLNKVDIETNKYYGRYYGRYYGKYYGRYYGDYYGNDEDKGE